ncbi:phage protein NinX family protein [Morganella morganii]|uniref:phage protein NinX family protein n=1 Tax=Morganella morganii TaxID=582 RepID=UPI00148216B1|nr:phage protein NinX family protein [Morganella morganii]
MNKYRDKSDFEINCQVLEIFEPDIKHMCLSHDEKSFYHFGFDGNGFYETTIPDYCNNPADAMPIIIENGISLIKFEHNYIAAAPGFFVEGQLGGEIYGLKSKLFSDNRGPYRAAMEVFLMMKDAENEKV